MYKSNADRYLTIKQVSHITHYFSEWKSNYFISVVNTAQGQKQFSNPPKKDQNSFKLQENII